MPISKFDDEINETKTTTEETKFESVREKRKKEKFEENFSFKYEDQMNSKMNFDEAKEYFINEKIKNNLEKKEYINTFLFTQLPPPRSPRMVDRLDLNSITLGRGKVFGPQDYFGFTLLTFFLVFLVTTRYIDYKTNSFKNIENINIYNAMKPAEVVRIYEDNEISPLEQTVISSKEHTKYKEKQIMKDVLTKTHNSLAFGTINDLPKTDLRKKLNDSINKN
jgi:hypothetical protein